MRAAIENGADAVYFGLDCGFNARYRAKNFGLDELPELMRTLRLRGVRGYATMNTLVFPSEMARLVEVVEHIAQAGVDAVLVQDFGVARIVASACPELEIHASTQMSLTSAETIEVAEELGLSRVVLARELSVGEIRKIAESTSMPLEVFIHGALCVAYSGQCLTSESLGGRSANRGQCAQACRLPYELIVDGKDRDLQEMRYLLSPQDLAGYAAIPDLIDAGVSSLKIEGRLKTPEYVANITKHYRAAIDQSLQSGKVKVSDSNRQEMELSFSRGFSPGWTEGNNHKRLVPGVHNSKRGIELGTIIEIDEQDRIKLWLDAPVALGDGLAIYPGNPDAVQGGRIYSLYDQVGNQQKQMDAGQIAWIGFGKDEVDLDAIDLDQAVFKNDDPKLNKRLRQSFNVADPVRRRPVDVHIKAIVGQPLCLSASILGGRNVTVSSEQLLEPARKHPADSDSLRKQVDRFGGTPFALGELACEIDGKPMVPASLLNELRRELVQKLTDVISEAPRRSIDLEAARGMLQPIDGHHESGGETQVNLSVLCRSKEQVNAAIDTSADLIYLDFHDIREYSDAVKVCKDSGKRVGIGTVRMQKPGEMGLAKVLLRSEPDVILARNLAVMRFFLREGIATVADFSLNVSNHRSAEWLIDFGIERLTASYDLNRDQLSDLIGSVPSAWIEIVLHQHMPMFHMEHCVFVRRFHLGRTRRIAVVLVIGTSYNFAIELVPSTRCTRMLPAETRCTIRCRRVVRKWLLTYARLESLGFASSYSTKTHTKLGGRSTCIDSYS